MIVTKLSGGLGNQMFQYALGRALALRHHTPLYVDTTQFPADGGVSLGNHHDRYSLDCFSMNLDEVDEQLVRDIPHGGLGRRMLTHAKNMLLQRHQRALCVVEEQQFGFDRSVLALPNNVYLSGDWQSEKYFFDYRAQILNDFAFKNPPTEENQQWLTKINRTLSVSLHIRRGDYLRVPATHAVHGVCALSYYQQALAKLETLIGAGAEYFVFSDDIDWCQQHLSLGERTLHYIANNTHASHEDLRLMSHCQHHIIANSSFSWWGAWLNPRQNKSVIAPKKWFNQAKMTTQDLIPETWIQL